MSRFIGDNEEFIGHERYPNFSLEQFFVENSIEWKSYDSGDHKELSINCPCCTERGEDTPDTKKKLWINVDKGTFYCYRCQWSGSFVRLIQKLSNTGFRDTIRILRGDALDPMEHMNLKLLVEAPEADTSEDELKELELPYGYEPIEGPHAYLEKRGIPWKYAAEHEWGVSAAGFTKDRIIVPTFMEGKLVFWQARLAREPNKDEKKVLNPKGVSARHVLYNYDVAKNYETIVVVEGFMDAAKVGPFAVATNGKTVHPQQVTHLMNTKAKRIVVMYDRDTWFDAKGKKPCSMQKAVETLRVSGLEILAVKMPDERDPGDYEFRSKELLKMIKNAKIPNF